MNKSFLLLAAVAILASCSQNDVFKDAPESSIDFTNVYIEKATKGAYNDLATFKANGNTFGVFGFRTKSSNTEKVFGERSGETYGVEVTSNGTSWSYTNTRYWDVNATSYSFYAYAPHASDFNGTVTIPATNAPNSFVINDFIQADNHDDMVDLLTDFTSQATNTSKTNNVEFTFQHILSSINLKMAVGTDLKNDYQNNPVTVVSVSINGIQRNADKYQYANGAWGWTMKSTATTANYAATQTSNAVFGSNELGSASFSNVPNLTDLLFIPQTVVDSYVITVQYKIGDIVYDRTIKLNEFKNTSNTALTTWQPGYKYTYELVIGPNPIVFDVTGDLSWTNTATYSYTIQ